jgi:lysophospholipase L1-like esterase
VLGIAGLGAEPVSSDAAAELTLRVTETWASGAVRWEVLFRLTGDGSSFDVIPANGAPVQVRATDARLRPSGLSSVVVETEGTRQLSVSNFKGDCQLFGVIVESAKPGVVLDTLGINGARVGTPVSWDRPAWVEEVRARRPTLAVLSYGTNEVGDAAAASSYKPYYSQLVGRLREAAPDADCLLVGPTDRARRGWDTNPRVLEIDVAQREVASELGCAFFSAFDSMGGTGSLRRWAYDDPQLARRDRVHLTPRGYERLGQELVQRLFESYSLSYESTE